MISEYSSGLIGPLNHNLFNNSDTAYAAAFLLQVLPEIAWMVDMISYWTFTDAAFAETGQLNTPFHNGYGVRSVDGIAKPAYRAFQILRNLPLRLAPIKVVPTPSSETATTSDYSIGGWMGLDEQNQSLSILLVRQPCLHDGLHTGPS